jgi:hypothetical protein
LRRTGILSGRHVEEERDLSRDKTVNTSRRTLLAGGVAVLAAGAAALAAQPARADDKLGQDVVQYQKTPNDGNKCSICVNFIAPNACKIVSGDISPEGWCVAFAPKG